MRLVLFDERGQDFEALPHIAHAQDQQAAAGGWHRGEVGILDVDFYGGEGLRDAREAAGAVVVFHHQNLALDDERSVGLQQRDGASGVAHHHAHHGVIDRVGNGEAVDVDLVLGQRVADFDERAGAVGDEDGELLDDADGFHGRDSGAAWMCASMQKRRGLPAPARGPMDGTWENTKSAARPSPRTRRPAVQSSPEKSPPSRTGTGTSRMRVRRNSKPGVENPSLRKSSKPRCCVRFPGVRWI